MNGQVHFEGSHHHVVFLIQRIFEDDIVDFVNQLSIGFLVFLSMHLCQSVDFLFVLLQNDLFVGTQVAQVVCGVAGPNLKAGDDGVGDNLGPSGHH